MTEYDRGMRQWNERLTEDTSQQERYPYTLTPVLDGVGGAILVHKQYRIHARMDPLLIGLGEGLSIWSNTQSAWNRDHENEENRY